MRWQSWTTIAVVIVASAALAWWQRHEYLHECELARETLHRQSHSVMNALIGGIRAHRNRGRFFANQLQGSLKGLVQSQDILAVAVTSDDGRLVLSAGKTDLLDCSPPIVAGDFWDTAAFRIVERFDLLPAPGAMHEGGGGRGWGGGRSSKAANHIDTDSPFSAGGKFAAILALDRTETDVRRRRAARLRGSLVAAGALVLLCVSLAWRVTVQAAGRTRLLEAEARHLRDLSHAAAGVAHETRNPLGLIRGWAQRLGQSGLQSQKQEEHAGAIVEECDRVTSRINQFLAFARPCEPQLESVILKEVVDELGLLLEPDLDAKNLTLSCASVKLDETVRADRELLRQALFNLIQNAVQASPDGQTVEILIGHRQDRRKRIEVTDHGSGVSTEVVDSLFAPYFTTRQDGTGLGLAIVRHIASAHGWEAGYTPRPGGGSIFWLDRIHV